MSGPDQDLSGADRIGDEPYQISEKALDRYPLMGNQVRPIKITDKSIDPLSATVGNNVAVKAKLESKYALGQVVVHAVGPKGVGTGGYVRMVQEGGIYQGTLATALMDPGRYDMVLDAKDARGNELKESLGEIEINPRGAGTFNSSLSNGEKL
jgi:nitrous oxidase accessory protein